MTIKVFDTFNDTPFTDLTSHTPDLDTVGGGWFDNRTNAHRISSTGDSASPFSSTGYINRINAGTTTLQCVTMDRRNASTGVDNRSSVLVRHTGLISTSDGYLFSLQPFINTLKILRTTAGSFTELTSTTFTMSATTTYAYKFIADGSSLDLIIDGISRLSTTDAVHASGAWAGIRSGTRVDNSEETEYFQVSDSVDEITLHQTTNYQGMHRMNGAMRS